jgi:hypothetical protein
MQRESIETDTIQLPVSTRVLRFIRPLGLTNRRAMLPPPLIVLPVSFFYYDIPFPY